MHSSSVFVGLPNSCPRLAGSKGLCRSLQTKDLELGRLVQPHFARLPSAVYPGTMNPSVIGKGRFFSAEDWIPAESHLRSEKCKTILIQHFDTRMRERREEKELRGGEGQGGLTSASTPCHPPPALEPPQEPPLGFLDPCFLVCPSPSPYADLVISIPSFPKIKDTMGGIHE